MARNRTQGGHGTIYGGGAIAGSPALLAGTNQGGGGSKGGGKSGGGGHSGGGGKNNGVPDFGTWGQGGQLSIFSNTNERNAAKVLQNAYGKAYDQSTDKLQGGWEGLKNRYGDAMDTLAAGAGTARGDITGGRDFGNQSLLNAQGSATGALTAGRDAGLGQLYAGRDAGIASLYGGQNAGINSLYAGQNQGVNALTSSRDAALGGFQPYAQTGAAANAMYGNATGLGGAAGNQAARDAFQTGPGYQFAMEQGLTGIDRRAASRGMLGSGNTAQDSIAYSQGLANQEYGQWLDRLAGQQGMGVNVAGQTAGINTGTGANLANLYGTTGANAANLYSTTGQAVGGLQANTGVNAANLYGSTAANLSGVYTGTGTQLSNNYTGAGTQLAGIAQDTAQKTAGIQTGLGDQRYQYGSDLAGLTYATRLGQGTAQANYLAGTDKLGANVINLGLGSANTAANILNPYGQNNQSSNSIW